MWTFVQCGAMNRYRYCVVGAGIVGIATAHHLLEAEPGAAVLVLEAEDSVAAHQTGHNSGVIHSGIYYEPGSLKAKFCKAGERAIKDFCAGNGIAFEECGKLIVATDPAEVTRLAALEACAAVNEITCRRVEREELGELEPNVTGLAALHLPSTGIVDYPLVARKLAELIDIAGGTVRTSERVVAITETSAGVLISTESDTVTCDRLVVCGGLQSDRLAELAGVRTDLQVIPFRGEYYQLSTGLAGFVRRLIYPVPDPELPFLGVHLSPTIGGAITVGPSAVLGLAREGYPKFSVNAARRRPDGGVPRAVAGGPGQCAPRVQGDPELVVQEQLSTRMPQIRTVSDEDRPAAVRGRHPGSGGAPGTAPWSTTSSSSGPTG